MVEGRYRVTRRAMLGGLLASAAVPACARAPETSIRPPVRPGDAAAVRRVTAPDAAALIAEAGLAGKVGFAVADARTGQLLEGLSETRGMPPASVAKAVTAMYALEALGANHRFRTRLIAAGPVRNGRLDGDLVLVGSGDPTLMTDHLSSLAAGLTRAGVREVGGRFLVYEGALPFIRAIDPDQPEHVGYNPSISGMNLNFNRVHFEWRRAGTGYSVAMDARSETLRPAVSMARMQVADRRSPIYTYAERGGVDDWTVARTALGKSGSRWLPVRRPAAYAGEVFQVLARLQGVTLGRPEPVRSLPQGTVLAEHVSDDLGRVVTDMLKFSTNITAEVLGLTASATRGGVPDSLGASAGRMGDWLRGKAGVNGARFVDHSGLGPQSRVAPQDMVRALVSAGAEGPLRGMMKRIDLKDAKGRTMRDHPVRVAAKTGTLNFVSGLAGYAETPGGRILAFAIFSADLDRRRGLTEEEMERPDGGRGWSGKARRLQQQLIERWAAVHES